MLKLCAANSALEVVLAKLLNFDIYQKTMETHSDTVGEVQKPLTETLQSLVLTQDFLMIFRFIIQTYCIFKNYVETFLALALGIHWYAQMQYSFKIWDWKRNCVKTSPCWFAGCIEARMFSNTWNIEPIEIKRLVCAYMKV